MQVYIYIVWRFIFILFFIFICLYPNQTWNFVSKIFFYSLFPMITGHGTESVTDEIWNLRACTMNNPVTKMCSPQADSCWGTSAQWSRKVKIEQWSRETRKWACSDLCKFSISTLETAEKICQLIFTKSMNFGSSDFSGFHNNMQAWYPLLVKFCWRKSISVFV